MSPVHGKECHSYETETIKMGIQMSISARLCCLCFGTTIVSYWQVTYKKKLIITSAYYRNLLQKLRTISRKKKNSFGQKGVLSLANNPPAHWAAETVTFLHKYSYKTLPHSPYLPTFLTWHFQTSCFETWKKHLWEKIYSMMRRLLLVWKIDLPPFTNFYKDWIKQLFQSEKCVVLEGEYVEKEVLENQISDP